MSDNAPMSSMYQSHQWVTVGVVCIGEGASRIKCNHGHTCHGTAAASCGVVLQQWPVFRGEDRHHRHLQRSHVPRMQRAYLGGALRPPLTCCTLTSGYCIWILDTLAACASREKPCRNMLAHVTNGYTSLGLLCPPLTCCTLASGYLILACAERTPAVTC